MTCSWYKPSSILSWRGEKEESWARKPPREAGNCIWSYQCGTYKSYSVTKLLSDNNSFNHFKYGLCSCKEFWWILFFWLVFIEIKKLSRLHSAFEGKFRVDIQSLGNSNCLSFYSWNYWDFFPIFFFFSFVKEWIFLFFSILHQIPNTSSIC